MIEMIYNNKISTSYILDLYKQGFFLMSKSRDCKDIFLVNPDKRALLPIRYFHVSRTLKRISKKKPFHVTINKNFKEVVFYCATINRVDTWINDKIEKIAFELHKLGFAHSIECWQNKNLVGGIYGISLGACFFAESMFSKVSNASSYALLNLVSRLYKLRYEILDVQFINEHLSNFGVYEISKENFKKKLSISLKNNINFYSLSTSDEDCFDCLLSFIHDNKMRS